MKSNDVGFLLNELGARLAVEAASLARELGSDDGPGPLNYAIIERGFVLITPAHRAVVVELCPRTVKPLAALGAVYEVKRMSPKCVLLALLGDNWRRAPYELLFPVRTAAERIKEVARAAAGRAAFEVKVRRSSASASSWLPPALGAPERMLTNHS